MTFLKVHGYNFPNASSSLSAEAGDS